MLTRWKNFHQTQYHMKILSFLYWVHTQDILFDAVEYQQRYRENPFCAWWRMFNAFFSTCAVSFRTINGQNNTRKCDTEGFVSVASLCGVVGSPFLFIRSLIGRTGNIWSVVYINAKWIYASKNLACTIRECATVRNVLHVTSTSPLISWYSGDANVKWTPQVWHSSYNSVEVNCVPAYAEIISKSHHPNWSISPNMYWNISSLSITSSVVISAQASGHRPEPRIWALFRGTQPPFGEPLGELNYV